MQSSAIAGRGNSLDMQDSRSDHDPLTRLVAVVVPNLGTGGFVLTWTGTGHTTRRLRHRPARPAPRRHRFRESEAPSANMTSRKLVCLLGGFEEEAGQVVGFGNREEDGMVAALGERGEYTGADAGVASSLAADVFEESGCDVVRAGEGQQQTARLQEAQGAEVDLLVAACRRLHRGLVAREGRRIEDHEAEALVA